MSKTNSGSHMTTDPAAIKRLVEATERLHYHLIHDEALDPSLRPELAESIAALVAFRAAPAPDREAVRDRLLSAFDNCETLRRENSVEITDAILAAIDGRRS